MKGGVTPRDARLRRDVAKHIVIATSRFLGITAACVRLLSFAAEHRKLYWNGCKKAAMVIFQSNFLRFSTFLALVTFLVEVLFFEIVLFSPLASGSGFGAELLAKSCVKMVLCKSFCVQKLLCEKACCV